MIRHYEESSYYRFIFLPLQRPESARTWQCSLPADLVRWLNLYWKSKDTQELINY
jgi:hypothetical protein